MNLDSKSTWNHKVRKNLTDDQTFDTSFIAAEAEINASSHVQLPLCICKQNVGTAVTLYITSFKFELLVCCFKSFHSQETRGTEGKMEERADTGCVCVCEFPEVTQLCVLFYLFFLPLFLPLPDSAAWSALQHRRVHFGRSSARSRAASDRFLTTFFHKL